MQYKHDIPSHVAYGDLAHGFQDESSPSSYHLLNCCSITGGLIQKADVIQVCVMKLAHNSEF